MDQSVVELVWRRADARCEYCGARQSLAINRFHIDHVIAIKHRGRSTDDNLALSCVDCNSFKGSNIAGIDPESGELVRLFNPRGDAWKQHFAWHGALLIGLTGIGRATIEVLRINDPERVALRAQFMDEDPNLLT